MKGEIEMIKIKLVLLIFLVLLLTNLSYSNVDFKNISLEKALVLANKNCKDVMIDFYTDWCVPCKELDKHIFKDSTISSFINDKYICLRINGGKGNGPEILEKFKIRKAYPTVLFLYSDGNEIDRIVGLFSKDDYYKTIKDYSEKKNTLSDLLTKFKAEKNKAALALKIGNKYSDRGQYDIAIKYYEKVVESDQYKNDEWAWFYLGNSYYRVRKLIEAKEAITKSVELNGNYENIRKFLNKINNEIDQQKSN